MVDLALYCWFLSRYIFAYDLHVFPVFITFLIIGNIILIYGYFHVVLYLQCFSQFHLA